MSIRTGYHNIHFRSQYRLAGSQSRYSTADQARFWAKVDRPAGQDACWRWTASSMDAFGHGQFTQRVDGKQYHLYAHRVAWELAYGPIPDRLCVCHHCDVARCVRHSHLFLGTQADNLADARAKGRLDETKPRTKVLTPDQRLDIFNRPNYRGVGLALAQEFGVSKTAISFIRNGRFARQKPVPQPLTQSVLEQVPFVQIPIRGEVA